MNDEQKKYQKLLKLKKEYSIIVYIGFGISVLFIIVYYLFFRDKIEPLEALIIFGIINAIFMFLVAKGRENQFKKLYDDLIVKKILIENFGNIDISHDFESKSKINQIGLFTGKIITTYNTIIGKYKNIPIEIIETKVETYESNPLDETSSARFIIHFKGLIYCYKLNIENKNNIDINSKYFLNDCSHTRYMPYTDYRKKSIYDNSYEEVESYSKIYLKKYDITNSEYNDWFEIHSSCNINNEFLYKKLLPLLLELRNLLNKKIFLSIDNNKIYIGVSDNCNLYKDDILSKIKSIEEERNKLSNHLVLVKKIIDVIEENIDNIKESKEV